MQSALLLLLLSVFAVAAFASVLDSESIDARRDVDEQQPLTEDDAIIRSLMVKRAPKDPRFFSAAFGKRAVDTERRSPFVYLMYQKRAPMDPRMFSTAFGKRGLADPRMFSTAFGKRSTDDDNGDLNLE